MAPELDFGLIRGPLLNLLALLSLKFSTFPSKNSKLVLDFFLSSNWNLHLRRNIRNIEKDELSSLLLIISPIHRSPLVRTLDFGPYPPRVLSLFPRFLLNSPSSPPLPSHFAFKTIWYPLKNWLEKSPHSRQLLNP